MVATLRLSPRALRRPFRLVDWLIPLIVISAIQLGSAALLRELFVTKAVEQTKEQLEQNTQLSEEQREEALQRTEQGVRIMTIVSPPFAILIACLLTATVLLLIVNFGLGGSARFAELWTVAILAFTPKVIESVLFTILARARSSIDIAFGPAALIADQDSLLRKILGVFDVFDFWMIGIQMVGVAAVTSLAKGKARTAVLILWIAYWLITMAIAVATRNLPGAP
jgi:hypothetical protein